MKTSRARFSRMSRNFRRFGTQWRCSRCRRSHGRCSVSPRSHKTSPAPPSKSHFPARIGSRPPPNPRALIQRNWRPLLTFWKLTPAAEFVPELAAHYPEVTLRHFTTMTSGYQGVGDEGQSSHGQTNTPFDPSPEPLFVPPGSNRRRSLKRPRRYFRDTPKAGPPAPAFTASTGGPTPPAPTVNLAGMGCPSIPLRRWVTITMPAS